MYLAVGLIVAIILFVAPPVIWVVWWLLADLGESASGPVVSRMETRQQRRYRPAA